MIEQMDSAMMSLQAAVGGRRLYGKEHPFSDRQLAACASQLAAMSAAKRPLRVVRLDNTLVFEDAQLPSSGRLQDVLIPLLGGHGVEWIEFQAGVSDGELRQFVEQLEQAPGASANVGTPHVRTGRIGRGAPEGVSAAAGMALLGTFDQREQVGEFQRAWVDIHRAAQPDERLAELVESIRMGVAVGADVCRQLVEVKNHDEYTFVHTVNVSILSAALAEAVGMTADQVFDITLAALLHDVGKQRTPLTILNKPGQLDDAERKKMERHTVDGASILLARRGVPEFAPIVAFEHHANLDGTGYPRLKRTKHPHIASQIVHVADVFDALRTNRPYRAAMEPAAVRKILMDGAGKSFDRSLVDLFLQRVVKIPASDSPDAKAA